MRDQKNALDRKVKRAAWAARSRGRSGPRPRRLTARENKKSARQTGQIPDSAHAQDSFVCVRCL